MRIVIVLSFFLAAYTMAYSQLPQLPVQVRIGAPPADTAKKPALPPEVRNQIKPYKEVVTAAYTSKKGMFTVHQHLDTFYFEIPGALLKRDIQVINRLVKVPGGSSMYSGEEVAGKTIAFEKNEPDSSIRLVYVMVIAQADSSNRIRRAVDNSYSNAVAFSFPIKAYSEDGNGYVIDVSQYIKSPSNLFNEVTNEVLNNLVDNKSFKDIQVESVHAYPINVEIVTTKNALTKKLPNSFYLPGSPATLVTNTSFVLLPEVPMQQRSFDPRVGYFADWVYSFADEQQQVEKRQFINRWRLEPRKEDLEKYKKGQLVEPQQRITIYIDPATPKQWRPYLIAGINDWQKAFEKAGFKNAIEGKEWPENNAEMYMDDARYSFLRYLPSEQKNAYGPNVHDPRSGEIIQTHIGWYHNVMNLLRNWYFIQAAATDPQARKPVFDEALMGNLIRFVSSHEVGHTLGLRHNFGSSSQTPVDSLRSKTYLAKHKHTASIMDYARFNFVAQPEDNIPQSSLFPGIGEYDEWAIEWGYKYSTASFEADKKAMRQLIVDRTTHQPRLWFGDGESQKDDPRCQSEDLGDNPMKANTYGIKNLQRVMAHLPEWSQEQGGIYTNLEDLYGEVKTQFTRYLSQVLKYAGGVENTIRNEQQGGEVYAPVSKAMQEEVLRFYDQQLFTTPLWLLDSKVTSKVTLPAYPDFVEDMQVKSLNSLLDIMQINKVLASQRQFPDKAYTVEDYLGYIHQSIWKELPGGNITSHYRRNLQKSYVGALQSIILSKTADDTENDAYSLVRADLLSLQKEINAALPHATDQMSKYHLEDLLARIKKVFETKAE